MSMFDFGMGPVPAHRHANGGGWVADTVKVADTAYVGPNAKVFGNAHVFDDAMVCGNAMVYGDAQVSGDAQVCGDARVYGNARVSDGAWVCGNARVYGNARVFGEATVFGWAHVYDNAMVFGDAQVYAEALVSHDAQVSGVVGDKIRNIDLSEVPTVVDLDKKMAKAVCQLNALVMERWHTCDTTHCRAGWAIHLAGEAGYALEKEVGPWLAGALIYAKSTGREEVPSFYADTYIALVDIRRLGT